MGTRAETESAPSAIGHALFSPVQQRVLGLLFGQPERRYQSAELIRMAGSGTGAVHRFLHRLAQSGLVRVTSEGRQKYYQANPASPVFEELVGLVRKTTGLVAPLRAALAPFDARIRAAFVYGSIASGEERAESDIDLMVVADGLDYPTLFEALQQVEGRLGRPITPNLMTPGEWDRKRANPNSFVSRLQSKPRLFIFGSDDDLREPR